MDIIAGSTRSVAVEVEVNKNHCTKNVYKKLITALRKIEQRPKFNPSVDLNPVDALNYHLDEIFKTQTKKMSRFSGISEKTLQQDITELKNKYSVAYKNHSAEFDRILNNKIALIYEASKRKLSDVAEKEIAHRCRNLFDFSPKNNLDSSIKKLKSTHAEYEPSLAKNYKKEYRSLLQEKIGLIGAEYIANYPDKRGKEIYYGLLKNRTPEEIYFIVDRIAMDTIGALNEQKNIKNVSTQLIWLTDLIVECSKHNDCKEDMATITELLMLEGKISQKFDPSQKEGVLIIQKLEKVYFDGSVKNSHRPPAVDDIFYQYTKNTILFEANKEINKIKNPLYDVNPDGNLKKYIEKLKNIRKKFKNDDIFYNKRLNRILEENIAFVGAEVLSSYVKNNRSVQDMADLLKGCGDQYAKKIISYINNDLIKQFDQRVNSFLTQTQKYDTVKTAKIIAEQTEWFAELCHLVTGEQNINGEITKIEEKALTSLDALIKRSYLPRKIDIKETDDSRNLKELLKRGQYIYDLQEDFYTSLKEYKTQIKYGHWREDKGVVSPSLQNNILLSISNFCVQTNPLNLNAIENKDIEQLKIAGAELISKIYLLLHRDENEETLKNNLPAKAYIIAWAGFGSMFGGKFAAQAARKIYQRIETGEYNNKKTLEKDLKVVDWVYKNLLCSPNISGKLAKTWDDNRSFIESQKVNELAKKSAVKKEVNLGHPDTNTNKYEKLYLANCATLQNL